MQVVVRRGINWRDQWWGKFTQLSTSGAFQVVEVNSKWWTSGGIGGHDKGHCGAFKGRTLFIKGLFIN